MRFLPLLCALVALLTSCGKGSSDEPYRVARDSSWYPLDFMGREMYIFAFSNDLISDITARQQVNVELLPSTWDELAYGLEHKVYDGILTSIEPTVENAALYAFSDPYLLVGNVVIGRMGETQRTLADFGGKTLGILTGSPAVVEIGKHPTILVRYYENPALALSDLSKQLIDGVVLGLIPASTFCADVYSGVLRVATPPFTPEALRLIVRQDDPREADLLAQFNKGLNAARASGRYKAFLNKWELHQ